MLSLHPTRTARNTSPQGIPLFFSRVDPSGHGLTRDLQQARGLATKKKDARRVTRQELAGQHILLSPNSFRAGGLNRPNTSVVKSTLHLVQPIRGPSPAAPEQWDLSFFMASDRFTPFLGT